MNRIETVIKRNGKEEKYNIDKIKTVIINSGVPEKDVQSLAETIEYKIAVDVHTTSVDVETIQDMVITVLGLSEYKEQQKQFIKYKKKRESIRQSKSDLMKIVHKLGVETDRDNANVGNNFSSKLLRIASETNKQYNLSQMPKHLAKAHENADYHIHDLDSHNLTPNCLHNDTADILSKPFNTGYGTINPPKRIESAVNLTCIIIQSCQNDMYGGQSCVDIDNALGRYIDLSRLEIIESLESTRQYVPEDVFNSQVESILDKHIHQAMQNICYNLNTMHSRAGSQVPFSSLNIGLPADDNAARICYTLLEEYDKGMGKGEQLIFPNIIFAVKKGINKNVNDPYYYLYEKACDVASRHMNPTFMNVDSKINMEMWSQGIRPAIMGCRTYLGTNINGEDGPSRRGNNAPVTINLPRIGIKANKDLDKFWTLLDEMLELSVEQLLYRHNVLCKLKVRDLPFVAGEGIMMGSENLNPDDSIEPIIRNGSYGIGFIGLAETLIALTGKHHGESKEADELGFKIVQHIRDFADKKKQEHSLNFACYMSPAESVSHRFTDADIEKYGIIEGVTDHEFYTNSIHVPVFYNISIKDKIDIESKYHYLGNGGHISYVEVDGNPSGKDIMKIVNYAFDTDMSYMGINFHIRYCKECGKRVNDNVQKCECGSTHFQGVSRVTGYLSLDERFGKGKTSERKRRVSHITGKNVYSN